LSGDGIEAMDGNPFEGRGASNLAGRYDLEAVRILPPIDTGSIFAPAQPNYRSHQKEHADVYGDAGTLDFNYRGLNSVVAHGEPVVIPTDATEDVVFEGELSVVIGRTARAVTARDAASYIFGYTIANDVTDRGWQTSDRTVWRAKNNDGFCPLGPWIETDFSPADAVTQVLLNGVPVVDFRTGDMIFNIPDMLARLSRYVTLKPGDILLCGTDEPTLRIVPGDRVDVSISDIGTLSNPVMAASCG
jgi:2-keto-4-pentenoate hydratase/2-oxohepta-3-ene-1,7-dioic acid hydratase in catechol pathway